MFNIFKKKRKKEKKRELTQQEQLILSSIKANNFTVDTNLNPKVIIYRIKLLNGNICFITYKKIKYPYINYYGIKTTCIDDLYKLTIYNSDDKIYDSLFTKDESIKNLFYMVANTAKNIAFEM